MDFETRVYAANGFGLFRIQAVDLHEPPRTQNEPIQRLPGLEMMADQGDEYLTLQLNMTGVVQLRRALQRFERAEKRKGAAGA